MNRGAAGLQAHAPPWPLAATPHRRRVHTMPAHAGTRTHAIPADAPRSATCATSWPQNVFTYLFVHAWPPPRTGRTTPLPRGAPCAVPRFRSCCDGYALPLPPRRPHSRVMLESHGPTLPRSAPPSPQHHCRECGLIYCHNCAKRRSVHPYIGVRVCDVCWTRMSRAQSQPPPRTAARGAEVPC